MKPKFRERENQSESKKYLFCSKCGETATYASFSQIKKKSGHSHRRQLNEKGHFVKNQSSIDAFKQAHTHCVKKCLNCRSTFNNIDQYNSHLPRCNIESLKLNCVMPIDQEITKLRNKRICKGENNCLLKISHRYIYLACHNRDCRNRQNCKGINCHMCNQTMIFEHYENHLQECKTVTFKIFQYGNYFTEMSKLMNISNASLGTIQNEVNNQQKLSNDGSSTTKSVEARSSGSLFHAPPVYSDTYNATRKLRKEVSSFLEDLKEKHNLSPIDFQLNILRIFLEQSGFDEVMVQLGYVKIYSLLQYSEILR